MVQMIMFTGANARIPKPALRNALFWLTGRRRVGAGVVANTPGGGGWTYRGNPKAPRSAREYLQFKVSSKGFGPPAEIIISAPY